MLSKISLSLVRSRVQRHLSLQKFKLGRQRQPPLRHERLVPINGVLMGMQWATARGNPTIPCCLATTIFFSYNNLKGNENTKYRF